MVWDHRIALLMLVERLSQLKAARRIRRIIKNSQPSKIHLEDQGRHLVLHQAEVDQLIEEAREEDLKVIEVEAVEEEEAEVEEEEQLPLKMLSCLTYLRIMNKRRLTKVIAH